MSVGFSGVATTLEQNGVLAGRGHQGQLVEGQDFAAVGQNALTGLLGHVKGNDLQRAKLKLIDAQKRTNGV